MRDHPHDWSDSETSDPPGARGEELGRLKTRRGDYVTGVFRLLRALRDDVRQAYDDPVVILRPERAIVVDVNLRGGDEMALTLTRRIQIEQNEAEIESGGRWRSSVYGDWLGGDGGDLSAGQGFPRVDVLDGDLPFAELHRAEVASFQE